MHASNTCLHLLATWNRYIKSHAKYLSVAPQAVILLAMSFSLFLAFSDSLDQTIRLDEKLAISVTSFIVV